MIEAVKVSIDCTNDAFFGSHGHLEIVRILRELADMFEAGDVESRTIRDVNGNQCGAVTVLE